VSAPVLVVGSIALDDIETASGAVHGVLGGAASYFAIAASYLAPVAAVGVVGRDFPREHLDFLASRGVDTAGVEVRDGKSFRWGGRYSAALDRRDTLFTELGVFDGWEPRLAPPQREAPFVFLANIHPAIQRRVREQVRAPRFAAMDSMNFWIERTRDDLARTLACVHGLVINDEEARQLTGESNLVRAARAIRDMGPEVVVVKRGEHGALLFDAAGIFAAPAFPLRDVVDPTGAGDSFAGGLMAALAADGASGPESLRRAVIYGSVMASFCVERFGLARFETLARPEVDQRFADFRALTRF
jgi:sugar/nucleoside kinase (ribokinase family)